jgi:hypothetical protein
MTTLPLFTSLQESVEALRRDLIHADGPQISTMRNYRFALLHYDPSKEFELRTEVQRLTSDLIASGWVVLSISLQKLFLERVRSQTDNWAERVSRTEAQMSQKNASRGLNYLKSKLEGLIEGPDGIAADCRRIISEHASRHPDATDRTVAIIGRTGALYPFFRSSALLRHLDGKTEHVPVVLLYPGKREGRTGLSFMGKLTPDHDYRPRIY